MQQFEPGDQVAYIPTHANGDIKHADVEYGFVTSQRGHTVFVRYWSKIRKDELRTKANSEGTDESMLKRHRSHGQSQVDQLMAQIADGVLR